ncbi:MAG TPA: hypothetical protein VK665_02220 [Candidatus Elarobacter sp.]|nr:hypothetical protein [Candidatus Elarobacter sp.]
MQLALCVERDGDTNQNLDADVGARLEPPERRQRHPGGSRDIRLRTPSEKTRVARTTP